jgi:hypothetical protein
MKKNRFIYLTILTSIILLNSCSKNDNKDCYFVPEIAATMDKSHPCLSTGNIEIIAPINLNYTYKIDQENFQHNTLFENISAGKHMLSVKDNNGCETSIEVIVDTITKGIKFTEVATILKTRCASCHSGINPQAGIDLTRICDVLNHWNRIQARALEGNPSPMPPSGLITANERNKLLDWINSGHQYEE